MLGAIIGGALSGVGSAIFGGGDKKQTTTSTVDYKKMVRNAEAAGFNPLTALRNGGAAGFSSSTTTQSGGGGLSDVFRGFIGGAMQGAGNHLSNYDPMKAARATTEQALLEAQLGEFGDRAEAHDRRMSTPLLRGPAKVTAGSQVTAGEHSMGRPVYPAAGPAAGNVATRVASAHETLRNGMPSAEITQTPGLYKAFGIKPHPDYPDVGIVEESDGDIISEIYSFARLGASINHTFSTLKPGETVGRPGFKVTKRPEGAAKSAWPRISW